MNPLFWVNRQLDQSPSSAITDEEKQWIEKHLGADEASIVVDEFGSAGTRSALLYLSLEDGELKYLTAYTAEADDHEDDEE